MIKVIKKGMFSSKLFGDELVFMLIMLFIEWYYCFCKKDKCDQNVVDVISLFYLVFGFEFFSDVRFDFVKFVYYLNKVDDLGVFGYVNFYLIGLIVFWVIVDVIGVMVDWDNFKNWNIIEIDFCCQIGEVCNCEF